MMIIYALKLDENISLENIDKWLELIDSQERNRFIRYKNHLAAKQFLLARVLLRYLLFKYYGLDNEQIEIVYDEAGKPQLKEGEIKFNISHSGVWIVCVISDLEVGVDIEKLAHFRQAVAKRVFTADEYAILSGLEEAEKIDYFYSLWTLKESYSKAVGYGLSKPFNSFSIKKDHLRQCFISNDNYFLKQYEIDKDYKLSVCSAGNNFASNIEIIDLQRFDDLLFEKIDNYILGQ